MERICADTLHSLFYDHPSNGKKFFANSEPIIVREMLHDVLDTALQDVAELVDGIDLHILIVPEPIELGAVYIIMGIKIVLRNAPLLHGLPQTVVFYHFDSPVSFILAFVLPNCNRNGVRIRILTRDAGILCFHRK